MATSGVLKGRASPGKPIEGEGEIFTHKGEKAA